MQSLVALLMLLSTLLTSTAPSSTPAPREVLVNARLTADFTTLDPARAVDTDSIVGLTHLFEGLVRNTPAGPAPGLAESWESRLGGSVYIFTLRPNLRWSNGDPLTADDFVYAWTRMLDPKVASPYAYELYPIVGAAAFNTADPESKEYVGRKLVLGIQALGPRTLRVALERPMPDFPALTGYPSYLPVPRQVVEATPAGEDWAALPTRVVGNGPFKVSDRVVGALTVLVKNPQYWNYDAVQIDRVHLRVLPDNDFALKMFERGELDLLSESPSTDLSRFSTAERTTAPLFTNAYLAFNLTAKPFDDPRVRRALALAVDRKALVGATGSVNRPLYAIVPSGAPDLLPGTDFRATGGDLFREDLTEAKRLLAEAGYPGGKGFPAVELLTSVNSLNRQVLAEVIKSWERNLGITSIRPLEVDFRTFMERKRQGQFAIARGGWIGDYPDALTFLETWVTGDSFNDSRYSNPEFDALMTQAHWNSVQRVRIEAMHKAEAILLREMPAIPLYEVMGNYLQSPRLTGVYWHYRSGFDLTGAGID